VADNPGAIEARPLLLRILDGERALPPPLWIMRQAGRYLPEYRELRAKAGSFLNLCYTPELAAEVTLQPIRRFGFDGAILFSDILVVPDALGVKVEFVEGEGPRLEPVTAGILAGLNPEQIEERLAPVFETIWRVSGALPPQTALLGFCGAPWTVASYMVAGRGVAEQVPARILAYRDPDTFSRLIDILVEASTRYLVAQFRAGVDAVQIFDSWSGALDEAGFRRWCLEPIRRVVEGLREQVPNARVIVFPKGAGMRSALLAEEIPVNAVGIDWGVDLAFARDRLQPRVAVQGNLDPLRLLAGGRALEEGVDAIVASLGGGRLIFNLGHGILPETPVAHVEAMVRRVRSA